MTWLLLAAAVAAILVLCGLCHHLAQRLEIQRLEYEIERTWNEAAAAEIAELRRQLAIHQHWHARSMMPVLGLAWRAGLGKGK